MKKKIVNLYKLQINQQITYGLFKYFEKIIKTYLNKCKTIVKI